jgi:hypothetical protein
VLVSNRSIGGRLSRCVGTCEGTYIDIADRNASSHFGGVGLGVGLGVGGGDDCILGAGRLVSKDVAG